MENIAHAHLDLLCLYYYSSIHPYNSLNQSVTKSASYQHLISWTYHLVNSAESSFDLLEIQIHIFQFWRYT
jgi:hypothetical protein